MKEVGLAGCVLAILGFGTQGVFVKSKAIRDAGAHPFLVVELFSLFTAVIGVAVAVASAASGYPVWEDIEPGDHGQRLEDAIYACLVYAPGNILLLWACRRIGVGLAVGIVSACATITSFVGGILFVDAEGIDLTLSIPAIAMIVFAAALMSATKIPAFKAFFERFDSNQIKPVPKDPHSPIENPLLSQPQEAEADRRQFVRWMSDPGHLMSEDAMHAIAQEDKTRSSVVYETESAGSILISRKALAKTRTLKLGTSMIQAFLVAGVKVRDKLPEGARRSMLDSFDGVDEPELAPPPELRETDEYATVVYGALDIFGISVSLFSGLFLGLQGVFWAQSITMTGLADSLATFMVVQFIATTVILGPMFLAQPKALNGPHIALTAPYAFAGALCFAAALTGQLIGLVNLAESIAMPLTQLNLLVAGLWGVFYFGEVQSRTMTVVFFTAMLIDIAAAILLNI